MQKNKFTVDTPDLLGLALEYRCASGTAFTLASGNEIYCGAGEFRRDCPAGFACVVGANNEYAVCCEGAPARSNVDERRGQFHIRLVLFCRPVLFTDQAVIIQSIQALSIDPPPHAPDL